MSVLKLLQKKSLAADNMDSESDESSVPPQDSDSEGEGEDVKEESAFAEPKEKQWKNRSRVLITAGRGHAPGFKTVIKDIVSMLPH